MSEQIPSPDIVRTALETADRLQHQINKFLPVEGREPYSQVTQGCHIALNEILVALRGVMRTWTTQQRSSRNTEGWPPEVEQALTDLWGIENAITKRIDPCFYSPGGDPDWKPLPYVMSAEDVRLLEKATTCLRHALDGSEGPNVAANPRQAVCTLPIGPNNKTVTFYQATDDDLGDRLPGYKAFVERGHLSDWYRSEVVKWVVENLTDATFPLTDDELQNVITVIDAMWRLTYPEWAIFVTYCFEEELKNRGAAEREKNKTPEEKYAHAWQAATLKPGLDYALGSVVDSAKELPCAQQDPSPPTQELTDREKDCIEIIQKAGEKLGEKQVIQALKAAKKRHGRSTIAKALGRLARDGLLTNTRGCGAEGYGLPEWKTDDDSELSNGLPE